MMLANVLNLATRTPTNGPADTITYPVVSAHRGGLTLYPENTLEAFQAIEKNHPGMPIEFDVRALADNTLVLSHDATVDRTSTTTGRVKNMTPEQWANVRIRNPTGGTAPATTLGEVLTAFTNTNTVLLPELKDDTIVNEFIAALWPHRHKTIVQTANTTIAARLIKSGFHTMQLSSAPITPIKGVYAVGLRHTAITKPVVDDMHTLGVTVWAWTVNDQIRIDELMNMDVDAVMTNDPRLKVEANTE